MAKVDRPIPPIEKQLRVYLPENLRAAIHSNFVRLTTTTRGEVFFDFVFIHPQDEQTGSSQGTVVSRIVLPLVVAQQFKMILESQLGKPKEV